MAIVRMCFLDTARVRGEERRDDGPGRCFDGIRLNVLGRGHEIFSEAVRTGNSPPG